LDATTFLHSLEEKRTCDVAENRWDNLKNAYCDSRGGLAKVGHAKLLKTEKSLTPPLGTNNSLWINTNYPESFWAAGTGNYGGTEVVPVASSGRPRISDFV
jgi:hypothetical protein